MLARVLSIGRTVTGRQHPKLRELVRADLYDYSGIESYFLMAEGTLQRGAVLFVPRHSRPRNISWSRSSQTHAAPGRTRWHV